MHWIATDGLPGSDRAALLALAVAAVVAAAPALAQARFAPGAKPVASQGSSLPVSAAARPSAPSGGLGWADAGAGLGGVAVAAGVVAAGRVACKRRGSRLGPGDRSPAGA